MVAGIPSDISYGLQCSTECFDITADVTTYYYRFNEVPLAPLVDAREGSLGDGVGESLRGLSRLYMRPYNDWFWRKASPVERAWCVAAGTNGFGRRAAENVDSLVSKFISDMLSQGRDPTLRREQQNWLDQSRAMNHISKITHQLAAKARAVDIDDLLMAIRRPQEFVDRLPELPPEPKLKLIDVDGRSVVTVDEDWRDTVINGFGEHSHPLFRSIKPPSASILAKKRRKKMSVLKKSSEFLSRLIGSQDVTLFVSGKEIRVEGQRFIFAISKANILSENHGALNISVIDRLTDLRMFDLCWYVERTPAMDQISALVMAVRAGNEDEIISVGNMLRVDRDVISQHEHMSEFTSRLGPEWFGGEMRIPGDDVLMHQFPGTSDYRREHPQVYRDFAVCCAGRMARDRFPTAVMNYFLPHAPETVRPFINGQVGRELLEEPRAPLLIGLAA